jgi:hypothetical protein
MNCKIKTTMLATALATVAVAAPSASAQPIDSHSLPTVPAVQATPTASSSGFDWSDAGLGAAGTLSLLGLGAGGVLISRLTRSSNPAIG